MARQGSRGFRPKLVSLAVASCFVSSAALANPTGAQVANGQVSVIQNGNLLQITNSPNSIINWQSFSIGANEITRFIQQSQASAVLNRVAAGNPSLILGALQSNGRVFLVNPSGITFGAGSQVDVAGLIATSLNLSNADFLAGKLKFTDGAGAGSVINQGNITATGGDGQVGQVYLVGNAVTNNGIITSPNGNVVLAAGNSVELVNPGTPNLRVEITAPDNEVKNLGQIVAESGRVGIYAGLINNSGTIRADSAVAEGGKILLKATKSVTLESTSILDASGNGGGRIDVLANDSVNVAGKLDASAPVSGDGGFIETSAHSVKVASGTTVRAGALNGKKGTWLIDPDDVVISAYGGTIDSTTLSSNLTSGGMDITIATNPTAYGGSGNITVASDGAVSWNSANSLTLTAMGDVDIDAPISNAGSGGLNIYAGWDGINPLTSATPALSTIQLGIGHIYFPASVSTAGRVVLVAGADIEQDTIGASITANQLVAISTGSDVTLTGSGNQVNMIAGAAKNQFQFTNGPTLTVGSVDTGNANIGTVSGIAVTGGAASVAITVGGPSNPGADLNVNSNITATASSSSSTISLSTDSSYGGAVNVNNASVIATAGTGIFGGGNASVSVSGRAGTNISGSTLRAQAGNGVDGGEGGNGGQASMSVNSDTGTLNITNSTLEALAGAGAPGFSSGSAEINLASNSPDAINLTGSTVRAVGGGGDFPGYGDVEFTTGNASNINITNSSVRADGAEGSIYVSTGGNITISGSTLSANGVSGASGAEAYIQVEGSTVTINNSVLAATGGNGSSGTGGSASVDIYANGIGGAHISGSTVSAIGGTGTTQGFGEIDIESGISGGNVVIDSSTIQAAGVGASIFLESSAGVTATNSTISATGQTGVNGSEGFVLVSSNGSIDTSGSTISAVGRTLAVDGGEGGSGIAVEAAGDVTLGLLASNEFVSVVSGGSILDGNAGNNIVANQAFLQAATGVGSLADPLETSLVSLGAQPPTLIVQTGGGEVGVINSGNLVLGGLINSGSGASAVGTTGTMVFSTPISVSGNLALVAGNGMVVEQPISSGGDLILGAGIGDLGFNGVSVSGNNVSLSGNNVLVGFTTSTAPTSVTATNLMTVTTAANLNVLGGSDPGASSVLAGLDVDLTVGTTGGFVNIVTGSGGAFAQISAGSPDTITLTFPKLSSGGFFVNGVEGGISDGNTGFFANGKPAVLGDSFMVTYGAIPPSALSSGVQQAIDQVVVATNQQTTITQNTSTNNNETEGEGGTGSGGTTDDKKKALPICGK